MLSVFIHSATLVSHIHVKRTLPAAAFMQLYYIPHCITHHFRDSMIEGVLVL